MYPHKKKTPKTCLHFLAISSAPVLSSHMPEETPPLITRPQIPLSRRNKVIIGLASLPAFFVGALILLRLCNLIRPFSVPTGAMIPAVSPGDHILMEGLTFLFGQPHRGDIVVFRTAGIESLPQDQIYVERVAGEPGDHVRISDGKLFINEKPVSLSNAFGEIVYSLPWAAEKSAKTDVTVPKDCYFVLGDNSTNSFDSRYWGSVPRGNIIGRVAYCYFPPQRRGRVQ
jgi:signal peptidase I